LQSVGAVVVLFWLSWRLGPVLVGVIVGTAATAALYKQQTKVVERKNASALAAMSNVASQAFSAITTVR
jgi:ABC-type multidrug transport system fused ATPase/permease subunit